MTALLAIAAAVEALTGTAVLASPALVARLLLGTELDAAGAALGRFGGIGLVCFAIACWPPSGAATVGPAARRAMLLFQASTTACLVLVALGAGLAGVLLWPAVAYHAGAAILLASLLARGAVVQAAHQ